MRASETVHPRVALISVSWPRRDHDTSVLLQAVEQLNIKAKNLRDLLTDEPFSRQDIITLQVSGSTGRASP